MNKMTLSYDEGQQ